MAVSDFKNLLFTFYNSSCSLFDFIEHILSFSLSPVKKSTFKR